MRILPLTVIGGALALLPVPAVPAHAESRGDVVGATRVARLSTTGVKRVAKSEMGLDSASARARVNAYRLTYRTVGLDGAPTTATGLVALPRDRHRRLPAVAWEHGTLATRAFAPSAGVASDASVVALLFASAGYAAVAPDYLGLGAGPGPHPYLHVASEVSASVDMLRAARTFAARRHRPVELDPRILVSGFSQGGAAAMGLARALEAGADPQLRLGAVAPVSGTYDLGGAEIPAMIAGATDPLISNYNLAYFALAWQRIYGLFGTADQIFRAPYDVRVPRLFDGRHEDRAIFAGLPHTLSTLFTPGFLDALRRPNAALAAAVRANDSMCDWRPHAPVRLYAAHDDRVVAFTNSARCRVALAAHGARAPVTDVGGVDHFPSEALAVPRVLRWFAQVSGRR